VKLYDHVLKKTLEVMWEKEGGSDEIKGSVRTYSLKVIGLPGYKLGYLLSDGKIVDQWDRPLLLTENSPIEKKVIGEKIEEKVKESSFWGSF